MKSWTSTRSKKAKERHSEVEVLPENDGGCKKKQEIQNKKMERRLLGRNLLFVQRIHFAADAKQSGRVTGSRRDEAVAKDENYEGFYKENQIKRKNGR